MNDIENVVLPTPAEAAAPAPEVKTPTPEEIAAEKAATDKLAREAAAKALADKIAARIAELKTFEGKTFVRNDGKGLPITVIKYAGIFSWPTGGTYYAFTVEIPGHARWNPSATDFLNEHHVIEVPAKIEINSEPK